ncbi:type III polyketide synthase [Aquisediminimonas sediminicola]|uniref:type III polyketide synthase n=1 Tax=Alteraquisediminimonas sediminicola TaxID=2676787 RepID=UPI001C8DD653|nr:type III polyketide synthase [Aquisediminimonas sediminicola]
MAAYINAIGTAVPDQDVHHQFVAWAERQLQDPRERRLFDRMVSRSGIERRWSVLSPGEDGAPALGAMDFYQTPWPSTAARMAIYARQAPKLAIKAVQSLPDDVDLSRITHLVVASCTGFVAPGVDQIIARELGLDPGVERLLVGFMGCYAAITALRTARHIVRSQADAKILVICVELSSLHLQDVHGLEPLLAMLQFGDGAAAALVSADPKGLEIEETFTLHLPDSSDLICWDIGDAGFIMRLSGAVPNKILSALQDPEVRSAIVHGGPVNDWAVHAGGRSILDAVQQGLELAPGDLDDSRAVLRDYGNMSSATLMFVLARKLQKQGPLQGVAMAFGPGIAVEGFHYRSA